MSRSDVICACCHQEVYRSDETYAGLSGGACIELDLDEDLELYRRLVQRASGFLEIWWRSPYSKGEGGSLEKAKIVEDGHHGQFDLAFCSTICLRSYLNSRVDALEGVVQSWYLSRVRFTLEQGDDSKAISEWQSYFGCSRQEAEEVVANLKDGNTSQ
ncbi:MAG: hypothetical protein AB7S38_24095 [Vulcanimicrobiota bacterium]